MYGVKKVSPESKKTGLGCSGYTHLFKKPRGKWVNLKKSSSETRPQLRQKGFNNYG